MTSINRIFAAQPSIAPQHESTRSVTAMTATAQTVAAVRAATQETVTAPLLSKAMTSTAKVAATVSHATQGTLATPPPTSTEECVLIRIEEWGDSFWGNDIMEETWKKERDACLQGDCITGCKLGLETRIKYIARGVVCIPVNAVSTAIHTAFCALTACGLLSCCGDSGDCHTCVSCISVGLACFGRGSLKFGRMILEAVTLPFNIMCTEGMSALGQHRVYSCLQQCTKRLDCLRRETDSS